MVNEPLRFDEQQDPEHDPVRDPVRDFKTSSERKLIQTVLITLAAITLLLPVLWWVLQQPV